MNIPITKYNKPLNINSNSGFGNNNLPNNYKLLKTPLDSVVLTSVKQDKQKPGFFSQLWSGIKKEWQSYDWYEKPLFFVSMFSSSLLGCSAPQNSLPKVLQSVFTLMRIII